MKIKVELENGIRLLWPTPIFDKYFEGTEAMNARLLDIIHEKERESEGITKSVVRGWHSADDVHTWDYPEIRQLLGFVTEAVTQLTVVSSGVPEDKLSADTTFIAWANILRKGGYHKAHTHPGCVWSGVYYVDDGLSEAEDIPDDAGCIEFSDPRHGVEMVPMPGNPFGQRVWYPPEAGRLLCFPAWLRHTVNPYMGERERVSIAFNVRVEAFEQFD